MSTASVNGWAANQRQAIIRTDDDDDDVGLRRKRQVIADDTVKIC